MKETRTESDAMGPIDGGDAILGAFVMLLHSVTETTGGSIFETAGASAVFLEPV